MKDAFTKHLRSMGLASRLVIAACIIGFLYYGQVVLIPFALALLVAFALHPSVRRLMRWKIPRTLSVGLVMAIFLAVIGGLSWFIGGQLSDLAKQLPSYRTNIIEKVKQGKAMLSGGALDSLRNTVEEVNQQTLAAEGKEPVKTAAPLAPTTVAPSPPPTEQGSLPSWIQSAGAITDPLATFGLVILLVVIMLLQWSDLRGRLLGFLSGNMSHTTQALADAGERIGRYLFLQLLYNGSFGIVVGLSLWAMKVPYAGLWGLCAALFRYLPYIGPVIAAALPLLVSLVTSDGWSQVASVGILFLVLELLSNNFVEPWLYGSRLGVSEIGIIMTTVAWTYLWGPAGLLLATPLTVCLVVLGTHVPALSFFAKILGNEKVFSGPQQIYQRLLAGDGLEAAELTQQHVRDEGMNRFVENVFLPALALARRDQVSQWLTPEGTAHITEEIEAVCDELSDIRKSKGTEPAAATPTPERPDVVLWSACGFTDAAFPAVLGELAVPEADIMIVRSTELTGGAVKRLSEDGMKPAAVSLMHLSEVDTAKAGILMKRLTRDWPGVPIQVARLGGSPFSAEEKARLTAMGASSFAQNLTEARIWLNAYAVNAKPAVN